MTKFTDKLDESLLGVMRGVMPNAPFFPEEVSESRVLSQARQQILEAIEEAAPEKLDLMYRNSEKHEFDKGYNQAITDFLTNLGITKGVAKS